MATTEPTETQLRKITETDQESSFDMINLIKYRPTAIYESAADNAIGRSGREAYQEYGLVAFLRLLGWAVAWSTKEHVTINLLAMSRRTTMT